MYVEEANALEKDSKELLDGPFIERTQIRYFRFDLNKYTDIFPILYEMLIRDFFPKMDEILDKFLIRKHWHEQFIQSYEELVENYEKRWGFPETLDEMIIQFRKIISETNKEAHEKGKEVILTMSAIYSEYIFLNYSEEGSYSDMVTSDTFMIFNKESKNFKMQFISPMTKMYSLYVNEGYECLFESLEYRKSKDGGIEININSCHSDTLN